MFRVQGGVQERVSEDYRRLGRGAQGVVLGCTEIPLLISQADRPLLPMFDTLELHVKAAALWAVQE